MSVLVNYPAKITSYSIFFSEDNAQIQLSGVEDSSIGKDKSEEKEIRVANIDFVMVKDDETPQLKSFINRGGFLQITRSMHMLSSILAVLEKEKGVQLDKKGNLSMNSKAGNEKSRGVKDTTNRTTAEVELNKN